MDNNKILIGFFVGLAILLLAPVAVNLSQGGNAANAEAAGKSAKETDKAETSQTAAAGNQAARQSQQNMQQQQWQQQQQPQQPQWQPPPQQQQRPQRPQEQFQHNAQTLVGTGWEVMHPEYGAVLVQLKGGGRVLASHPMVGNVTGTWRVQGKKLIVNASAFGQTVNINCDIRGDTLFYKGQPIYQKY